MQAITMREKRLFIVGFALLGFAIGAAEFAYTEYTYHHHIVAPDALFFPFLLLCPPSFLGVAFIDSKSLTEHDVLLLWSIVALLNSALYAFVAASVSRRMTYMEVSDRTQCLILTPRSEFDALVAVPAQFLESEADFPHLNSLTRGA